MYLKNACNYLHKIIILKCACNSLHIQYSVILNVLQLLRMLFMGEEYPRNSTKIAFPRIPVMEIPKTVYDRWIYTGTWIHIVLWIINESRFIELEDNLYNYIIRYNIIRLSLKVMGPSNWNTSNDTKTHKCH